MKKGYLVTLHYCDGCDYEPMVDEWLIGCFESREDAETFCKNNSDTECYYYIHTDRVITLGDIEPIIIEHDEDYDPEDDHAESYWFSINEINIIEKDS